MAMSQGLRSPADERLSGPEMNALFAHRALTDGTADMPGPSGTSGGRSNTILTGTRWTILTQLPLAFSAGSTDGGAGAGPEAVDMALEHAAGIGVDGDLDWIAGPYRLELRLLEVRRNPDGLRHKHHQRLADRCVIAPGGSQSRYPAGFRRRDQRAREIGFGDLQLRHGLLALRLQHRKLLLRDDDVALRGGEIRLRLAQARRVLLRLLDGDRALAHQIGVTPFLLLRRKARLA